MKILIDGEEYNFDTTGNMIYVYDVNHDEKGNVTSRKLQLRVPIKSTDKNKMSPQQAAGGPLPEGDG